MTERATVRTPMTDAEFLRWNPRWNDQDLAIIKEHLDDAGAAAFEEVDPPGYNLYVEVSHADGNVLMHASKGTIYRGDDVIRLSTTSGGGHPAKPKPKLHPLCETCWLHHPEGDCDS